MIRTGGVGRANLGVVATTLSATEADWETRAGFSLSEGAFVQRVLPDSPAAAAGVRALDVIERLGPHSIRSDGDLNNALVWLRPGERHTLVLRRYPEEKFRSDQAQRVPDEPGEALRLEVVLAR